jgi:hypothetical protein
MLKNNNNLKLLYAVLKEQKRNQAKRRFYYRKIEREKLRLAELGECQECIKNYCRYLANIGFNFSLKNCLICESSQIAFNFA